MKRNHFVYKLASGVIALTAVMTMSSCSGFIEAVLGTEDNPSGSTVTPSTVPGIPSDASATPNPTLPQPANTTIPNPGNEVVTQSGQTVVKFNLTGIVDPTEVGGWLKLYGTGSSIQNVWLSIDGNAKGIAVINTIDQSTVTSAVDLVFLVDNSGSMDEEADAVANGIDAWSKKLSQTLDMRFGCVGYDGYLTGALNMTTVNELSDYLSYGYGTSRTYHFGGDDAAALQTAASSYHNNYYECGVAALHYATDQFKFRSGANRVFVNFTDEPNQPNGQEKWSVEWVNPVNSNWTADMGTIHTVFSDPYYTDSYNWTPLYEEKPWLLSEYTGGTTKFAPYDFSGVTLDDLPVTGALMNSYVISVTNVTSLFDGLEHIVKITILNADGTIRAEKEFPVVFTK
jgi:hypothetical protein